MDYIDKTQTNNKALVTGKGKTPTTIKFQRLVKLRHQPKTNL